MADDLWIDLEGIEYIKDGDEFIPVDFDEPDFEEWLQEEHSDPPDAVYGAADFRRDAGYV